MLNLLSINKNNFKRIISKTNVHLINFPKATFAKKRDDVAKRVKSMIKKPKTGHKILLDKNKDEDEERFDPAFTRSQEEAAARDRERFRLMVNFFLERKQYTWGDYLEQVIVIILNYM
jgi:hypothetical protein